VSELILPDYNSKPTPFRRKVGYAAGGFALVAVFGAAAVIGNGQDNRKHNRLVNAEFEHEKAKVLNGLTTATFTEVELGQHLDGVAGTPSLFRMVDSNFHNGYREELGRNGYGPNFLADEGYTALLLKPNSCGEAAVPAGDPNIEVMHVRSSTNVTVDYEADSVKACNTDPSDKNVVVIRVPVPQV